MGIEAPLSEAGSNTIIILGAGLAGLTAGFALAEAGQKVVILESDSVVGGLSKTIVRNKFRFDLGGHRFFTNNLRVERFVKELMTEELQAVPRKSKIYLMDRYFDYPLNPWNVICGVSIPSILKITFAYIAERLKGFLKKDNHVSLEDWVVSRFGRPMFNLYFKEYSEKVWGIKCEKISSEWVAERIKGLSLSVVVNDALFKLNRNKIPTLADRFLYPRSGIGQIALKLKETINNNESSILMDTEVEQINHSNFRIDGITARNKQQPFIINGSQYISSIPMPALVQMFHPQAPDDVLEAASNLRYRDIVIVTIMLNRRRITDETWIYFPEEKIPFGRLHEPTNWSKAMAPPGKTLLVAEYFCFKGDKTWRTDDKDLAEITILSLENLGFIKQDEVIDSVVLRIANAYPLLETGYREHYDKIWAYLSRFKNLHFAGRTGMFEYRNIDKVIESGLLTAENIVVSHQPCDVA